jgi:hypothetical protein
MEMMTGHRVKVNEYEVKTETFKVLSIAIFHPDYREDKCPADFTHPNLGKVHRLCATE